ATGRRDVPERAAPMAHEQPRAARTLHGGRELTRQPPDHDVPRESGTSLVGDQAPAELQKNGRACHQKRCSHSSRGPSPTPSKSTPLPPESFVSAAMTGASA